MPLYDGFFDAEAILDDFGNETGEYDREYDSGAFVEYFAQFIGSGVCVLDNPDSFKVRFEAGAAVVSPGYLFIQGYWLKNDEDYVVALDAPGTYAVVAHLNTGKRMIEIEPRSVSQAYPDSLVLGIVSTASEKAEDTRYNTDICGVIDSAGSLSKKVQYAIHYIDNEVEGKLDAAEQDILAQSALLDRKIAEVQAEVEKLAPPPIGTVKFSASKDVSAAWLRCDGSYINEADYPELVAALGMVSPGAQEFWEGFKGAAGSGLSNGYLYEGTLWVYSASDKKLYGYTGASKQMKALEVTGADKLTASAANPICLSITGGSLFLAQNQTSANTFVLLEKAGFTGSGNVAMNAHDINSVINRLGTYAYGVPHENFIPEVCSGNYDWAQSATAPDIQDCFYMCLGCAKMVTTNSYIHEPLFSIVWKKTDFASAKIVFEKITFQTPSAPGAISNEDFALNQTMFRYSHKNNGELTALKTGALSQYGYYGLMISLPNGTYAGTTDTSVDNPTYGTAPLEQIISSAVFGNGSYIYRCFVSAKKLNLRVGKYNPNIPFAPVLPTVAGPTLPSRANVFPDSVCYAANQDLWFVFVGTGLAFSQTPEDGGTWGYFDTQDVLGTITQFGCLEYDPDKNFLYISGQDTTNKGKLGVVQLPELYNYANDGAWLPMIASDGIPAYIKAREED